MPTAPRATRLRKGNGGTTARLRTDRVGHPPSDGDADEGTEEQRTEEEHGRKGRGGRKSSTKKWPHNEHTDEPEHAAPQPRAADQSIDWWT